ILVDGTGFLSLDRAALVDAATENVHDATEGRHTDGHRDRSASVDHAHATTQTVGRTHGDGANHAIAQLLLDFKRQTGFGELGSVIIELESVIDVGNAVAGELNI